MLVVSGWWLVLGFGIAGLVHVFLPVRFVERQLGGRGLLPIIKAALIGAPIPLCSCSVIPTAAALRARGVSPGATTAFAISTPEVDAPTVSLTWGLLGPWMALARPLSAIITAVATGAAVQAIGGKRAPAAEAPKPSCCCSGGAEKAEPVVRTETAVKSCCVCGAKVAMTIGESDRGPTLMDRVARAVMHGFVVLPRSLAPLMLVGLVLAAVAGVVINQHWLASVGNTPIAYAVAAGMGIPLYICSASSTPFAAALVASGLGPGPALVLLLTGPATNTATILWAARDLGVRAAIIYVLGIAIFGIAAGVGLDVLLRASGAAITPIVAPATEHAGPMMGGVVLSVILGLGLFSRLSTFVFPTKAEPARA